MKIRNDITELLHADLPLTHICRQLRVGAITVQRTREALGLPAPRAGRRPLTMEEAFRKGTRPIGSGHLLWIGHRSKDNTPRCCFNKTSLPAPRASFLLHHGREPIGKALPTCGLDYCVAGEHLADRPMREANQRADRAFAVIFGGDR